MAQSIIKKLQISSDNLDKEIPEVLKDALNKGAQLQRGAIVRAINDTIDEFFRQDAVWLALGEDLQAHFGLYDAWVSPAQEGIIEGVKKETVLLFNKFTVVNGGVVGGYTIKFLIKNMAEILRAPNAIYVSERSGEQIEWLRWLLEAGAHPIILNYRISYGNYKTSRSQKAIMKPTINASWSVPAQYSGTKENNFITRVINSEEFQISITNKVDKILGEINGLLQ